MDREPVPSAIVTQMLQSAKELEEWAVEHRQASLAEHEQGVDVVLFGTGDKAHVGDNVASILRPPLAPPLVERLHASFGHLTGVGLDRPGPVKAG